MTEQQTTPLALHVSEWTAVAIEKFTQIKIRMETTGGMSKQDWEHARSYAVEALQRFLYDNPETFRYANDVQAISDAKKTPLDAGRLP